MIYGGIRPAIFDQQYRGHLTRWVFKNVPPFIPEKNMGSPKPYYARLEFALPDNTWQHVSEKYAVDYQFHRARVPPWPLTRLAKELTAGMSSDLQKARAISDYVKRNFAWNGISDWVSDTHQDILTNKRGSSADLNHLVNTMLLQVGLKPRLLLLSTRSHGEILKEVPSITQFNYVISALTIDGQEYFIDSTDPMLPFGVLPEECVNVEAMEAREKDANWIRIESSAMDKVNVTARLALTPDLTLKARVSVLSFGYAARDKRVKYQNDRKFFDSELPTRTWENDSTNAINAEKVDQPFQEVYYPNIPGRVQETPERLYLDPFILLRENDNPWKSDQRRYPIDMGFPSEKLLVVTLTIPEECEVESVPATEAFSTPDNAIACGFKVLQNNNILVISFQHVTSRSLFPKENYAALREFFNRMIAKTDEPIVLRKKSGR